MLEKLRQIGRKPVSDIVPYIMMALIFAGPYCTFALAIYDGVFIWAILVVGISLFAMFLRFAFKRLGPNSLVAAFVFIFLFASSVLWLGFLVESSWFDRDYVITNLIHIFKSGLIIASGVVGITAILKFLVQAIKGGVSKYKRKVREDK